MAFPCNTTNIYLVNLDKLGKRLNLIGAARLNFTQSDWRRQDEVRRNHEVGSRILKRQ